jgi:hypothetical protein
MNKLSALLAALLASATFGAFAADTATPAESSRPAATVTAEPAKADEAKPAKSTKAKKHTAKKTHKKVAKNAAKPAAPKAEQEPKAEAPAK